MKRMLCQFLKGTSRNTIISCNHYCHNDAIDSTVSQKATKFTKFKSKEVDFSRLDLKVGTIQEATLHPNADSLYIEIVDVGENLPRTVISSLVNFMPVEELQGKKAIFLCNLKPQKMRGILSEAMILCAETKDKQKCEIIMPPESAQPGDFVTVKGFDTPSSSDNRLKLKIFQTIAKDFLINDNGEATYKSLNWLVNGQNCTTRFLKNTPIS